MSAYAIASGHPLTSQAAATMLKQGGNAYDAVLAAMMMSFVAEPLLSSPGGGGLMLAGPIDGSPIACDFFALTPQVHPASLDRDQVDFYPIMGNFGDRQQQFHVGAAACAVPLAVAGIYAIHESLATMPLDALAAPAIQAANQGVVVNQQQAFVTQVLDPIITSNPTTHAVFSGLKQGHVWKNPQLASFLDTLSKQDHDWFYQGEVAKWLCQQTGTLLTLEDFAAAQVGVGPSLAWQAGQWHIHTAPTPSAGGQYVLDQLQSRVGQSSLPLQHLQAMQSIAMRPKAAETARGTSHISVVDAQGNLASMTLSNGEGNGHTLSPYGFMMNNFLGEEDINPNGFFAWQPGQKMHTMMAPSLMINSEQRIALGTGGSNRIKSALYQAISRISQGQDLKQAINAARIHHEKNHLDIEPGHPKADLAQMTASCPNHTIWSSPNLYFGGINAVQHGAQTLGYADFRRHGCGITGI